MRLAAVRRLALVGALVALVGAGAAAPADAATTPGLLKVTGGVTETVSTPEIGNALLKGLILPVPVDGAKLVKATLKPITTTIDLPISGGKLDPNAFFAGTIRHSGGLKFVKPTALRSVTVSDFAVKIDANPRVIATVNHNPAVKITLFSVDLSGLTLGGETGKLVLGGVKLVLTQQAADLLNGSLHSKAFVAGTVFATATTTLTYVQT